MRAAFGPRFRERGKEKGLGRKSPRSQPSSKMVLIRPIGCPPARVMQWRSSTVCWNGPALYSHCAQALVGSSLGWGVGGRNGLWAKVAVNIEEQQLGCQSVMLLAAGDLSSAFSWLSQNPAPQYINVIKEAVLQKILCVVGPGRCEAKRQVNHKQVIFFSVDKYFLSFSSA